MNMSSLKEKIQNKTARLGVVGLGYVGLPLAVEKAMAGFKTIGFDVQKKKVDLVNQGINYIGDVEDEQLKYVVEENLLSATVEFEKVAQTDCVCICVPTPLDCHQQPDLTYVMESTQSIVPYLHPDMLIVLESTTYPGTTKELIQPLLESTGYVCGKDFYLAFSPERVDPGNRKYKTKNTPKVVGGITKECTQIAAMLYENVLEAPIYQVSSPTIAEMEKILENTYRNVNIGLVNEFAMLCERMNVNLWEVIDAAKTKPYGFQPFYPGPGLGGHCIPLDPYYLSWKAREYGFHTSMIEAAMMINDNMPQYCVERISKLLNKAGKSLLHSRILVLGVAYKQEIDDYRESPAIKVIDLLEKQGAEVVFFDPYIKEYQCGGRIAKGLEELTEDVIQSADLVTITCAHQKLDYEFVQQHAALIFDTKNAARNLKSREKIELL